MYFETKGIKYQFSDKTFVINDVSFTAKRGELIGIMGTSGCGKTTLLNILNGYYKAAGRQRHG
ncbi:MAG: ATP-binding cassette domain-containing protein [Bacteroidales bacterium]